MKLELFSDLRIHFKDELMCKDCPLQKNFKQWAQCVKMALTLSRNVPEKPSIFTKKTQQFVYIFQALKVEGNDRLTKRVAIWF